MKHFFNWPSLYFIDICADHFYSVSWWFKKYIITGLLLLWYMKTVDTFETYFDQTYTKYEAQSGT